MATTPTKFDHKVRVNGQWRTFVGMWARVNGAWRPVNNGWSRVEGGWRPWTHTATTPGQPTPHPPVTTHTRTLPLHRSGTSWVTSGLGTYRSRLITVQLVVRSGGGIHVSGHYTIHNGSGSGNISQNHDTTHYYSLPLATFKSHADGITLPSHLGAITSMSLRIRYR